MVAKYSVLKKLDYFVSDNLLKEALDNLPSDDFRFVINEPTGNFFYDTWKIKSEFKDTVWDSILTTLPFNLGEARIIVFDRNGCYYSHSDIDDRWHLNIQSKGGYLISLDTSCMFELKPDGIWYDMDAGHIHTAVNFGNRPRIQLVVRKLLLRSDRTDLIDITITTKLTDLEDARYEFDNSISPLLNMANKQNALDNFKYSDSLVSMSMAPEYVEKLIVLVGENFGVNKND